MTSYKNITKITHEEGKKLAITVECGRATAAEVKQVDIWLFHHFVKRNSSLAEKLYSMWDNKAHRRHLIALRYEKLLREGKIAADDLPLNYARKWEVVERFCNELGIVNTGTSHLIPRLSIMNVQIDDRNDVYDKKRSLIAGALTGWSGCSLRLDGRRKITTVDGKRVEATPNAKLTPLEDGIWDAIETEHEFPIQLKILVTRKKQKKSTTDKHKLVIIECKSHDGKLEEIRAIPEVGGWCPLCRRSTGDAMVEVYLNNRYWI